MQASSDTIAAIATARGRAALGIVRISGPEAVAIAAACFEGADLREAASHTAHVGYVASRDGTRIDQVVATLFRAPVRRPAKMSWSVRAMGAILRAGSF